MPGANTFEERDQTRYPTPADAEVIVRSNGGGGWGNPLDRDPERVRVDVIEGYVSFEHARSDYGVVLNPRDNTIDAAATTKLRGEMRVPA